MAELRAALVGGVIGALIMAALAGIAVGPKLARLETALANIQEQLAQVQATIGKLVWERTQRP